MGARASDLGDPGKILLPAGVCVGPRASDLGDPGKILLPVILEISLSSILKIENQTCKIDHNDINS